MKSLHKIVAALAVVTVFGAGVVVGQQGDDRPAYSMEYNNTVNRLDRAPAGPEYRALISKLARIYRESPQKPELVEWIMGGMLSERNGYSNPLIKGQALEIAQNARIIELLEAQAKAKQP